MYSIYIYQALHLFSCNVDFIFAIITINLPTTYYSKDETDVAKCKNNILMFHGQKLKKMRSNYYCVCIIIYVRLVKKKSDQSIF